MSGYKTIYKGATALIVEKKSKFIATVFSIKSEEEAISYIEATRKKYFDARHNCFAYVCGMNNEIIRFSDDGEPSQTAGKPILDVILNEGIKDVCIVVTRYFGGTLLGTGGLVRAYTSSSKEALNNSEVIEKIHGKKLCIDTDYTNIGKIQYIINEMELISIDTEYTDKVSQTVFVPCEKVDTFSKKIIEVTSATSLIDEIEDGYFAILDGKIIDF